ncbi:hypothetical protein M758_UG177700 [Ceratodon purpureus]|nr:hypothetical protein M758_UG177700 [Ceratodon purpureus]
MGLKLHILRMKYKVDVVTGRSSLIKTSRPRLHRKMNQLRRPIANRLCIKFPPILVGKQYSEPRGQTISSFLASAPPKYAVHILEMDKIQAPWYVVSSGLSVASCQK